MLMSPGGNPWSGADPGFFLGGGALVSCSTSTPINHIVFFFGRIPVVLENRRSSWGGGAHPLHLPPRSTADGPPSPRGIVGTLVGKLELILVAREEGGKHSLLGPKSLSISYPHTILPLLHSLNASKSLF